MKMLRARLERLIWLAAPDTLPLQLEDGQVTELTREDIWNAFVELLFALREDRDHYETEALAAIGQVESGQHPMVDLV